MNTVFQVRNFFDHDIVLTSSIGLNTTIAAGEALDINFPSDVHRTISVDIAPPAGLAVQQESAPKKAKKPEPVAAQEGIDYPSSDH